MSQDFQSDFSLPNNHFNQVIPLHENQDLSWSEVVSKIPLLPRGWYELSKLPNQDRVEFTSEYWMVKVPLYGTEGEKLEEKIRSFFDAVEEVGIFATQEQEHDPFEVHLVYSLKDSQGVFHGYPPATDEQVATLQKQFGTIRLPPDYLAFLQIHDGFSKLLDTGLIRTRHMAKTYLTCQQILQKEPVLSADGQLVNPSSLIPFYESYGLHCYQCFYADWYVEDEMGNIYFSESEKMLSNFLQTAHLKENLAFPTFLDWLVWYLEER